MGMRSHRTGWLRNFALWVLFAPFLLTSLIAPGVMPVRDASGVLVLVICSAEGMTEIAVDPLTLEPLAAGDIPAPEHKSDHCAWANAHVPLVLVPPLQSPLLTGQARASELPSLPSILAIARETGLPPATGPPVSV
ncbi:hypothetical protein SAMN05519105_4326 [Rhodobacter sp. 24-YEA-8]|nr:hypothetical protein SAMN05519105_4326 [Rhodobacter sp. 24-YEA-8]